MIMMIRMGIIRESVKIVSDLKLLSDSPACQTNKSDHERSFFIVSSNHHHQKKKMWIGFVWQKLTHLVLNLTLLSSYFDPKRWLK